jgi:hypothetical protein
LSFASLRSWMTACARMTKDRNCDGLQMANGVATVRKGSIRPENKGGPNGSDETLAPLARSAQAASAPGAPPTERPEIPPQAFEKAQSAPENKGGPNGSDETIAPPPGPRRPGARPVRRRPSARKFRRKRLKRLNLGRKRHGARLVGRTPPLALCRASAPRRRRRNGQIESFAAELRGRSVPAPACVE